MDFVVGSPVLSCDLYLASNRMTLWSEHQRGECGFEMCLLQMLPNAQVQSVLYSGGGCDIFCSRLGRCMAMSRMLKYWLLPSLIDSSVIALRCVLSSHVEIRPW